MSTATAGRGWQTRTLNVASWHRQCKQDAPWLLVSQRPHSYKASHSYRLSGNRKHAVIVNRSKVLQLRLHTRSVTLNQISCGGESRLLSFTSEKHGCQACMHVDGKKEAKASRQRRCATTLLASLSRMRASRPPSHGCHNSSAFSNWPGMAPKNQQLC